MSSIEETKRGDKIRLIHMGEDPCPVPSGSTGTVRGILNEGSTWAQVMVDWDNGRSLMLLPEADTWEVIESARNMSHGNLDDEIIKEALAHMDDLVERYKKGRKKENYLDICFALGGMYGISQKVYDRNDVLERSKPST